jgi:hypothetical protein
MLKPRVSYLCAFDSWCALGREEQGNHVKLERRGGLKKRKEEKAIKGQKNYGEFKCFLYPASVPALATSFETWGGGKCTCAHSCA